MSGVVVFDGELIVPIPNIVCSAPSSNYSNLDTEDYSLDERVGTFNIYPDGVFKKVIKDNYNIENSAVMNEVVKNKVLRDFLVSSGSILKEFDLESKPIIERHYDGRLFLGLTFVGTLEDKMQQLHEWDVKIGKKYSSRIYKILQIDVI